jgi:hypothetical protein
VAQLVLSPLAKPYVPPLRSAIVYLVKGLSSGRARRIAEVLEPETDFGHHCKADGAQAIQPQHKVTEQGRNSPDVTIHEMRSIQYYTNSG